jgi:hypothetical protein
VQARRHAKAVERPFELEPVANLTENGHLSLGPGNTGLAIFGEARIGDLGVSHATDY